MPRDVAICMLLAALASALPVAALWAALHQRRARVSSSCRAFLPTRGGWD